LLQALAKDYGFSLKLYPVPAAEMQNQSSLWLDVRLLNGGRVHGAPALQINPVGPVSAKLQQEFLRSPF
jgi:hypothetical protein